MNILFVSAVLPYPLHSGGQVRMYNLIKQLSTRHEITLVSFIRDESERTLTKHLHFCKEVHMVMRGRAWQPKYILSAMFGKYPFLLATYDNEEMMQKLIELTKTRQFDLIHIEPFYVWPSIPETKLPLVVSEHNVEYEVYGAYGKKFPLLPIDTAKLRKWEQSVWKKADYVTAVSEHDKKRMQPFASKSVTVVPNGVDLKQFLLQKHTACNYRILFVGNFRWLPNRDAARTLVRDIWPLIKNKYPQSSLRIIGVDAPADLRTAGVEVVEHVENILVEYTNADVLIAPHTIGGGTKFKMLEAMASGLPIVTTPEGMSGLEAKPDVHYQQAETPADFVAKTTKIWENRELAGRMTRNARTLIEENYTWEQISKKLDNVWKK